MLAPRGPDVTWPRVAFPFPPLHLGTEMPGDSATLPFRLATAPVLEGGLIEHSGPLPRGRNTFDPAHVARALDQ